MAIFGGNSRHSEERNLIDPFDSFDDQNIRNNLFAPVSRVSSRTTPSSDLNSAENALDVNKLRRRSRHIPKFILIAMMLGGAGWGVGRLKPWTYFGVPDVVYAYFEIRALDVNGRPVAGAIVKNSGKQVGTTDSFGEWRRYMRVPLGATIPISIAKKSGAEILYATKNFAVSPSKADKSDLEVRGNVSLRAVGKDDLEQYSTALASNEISAEHQVKTVSLDESANTPTLTGIDRSQTKQSETRSETSSTNERSENRGSQVAKLDSKVDTYSAQSKPTNAAAENEKMSSPSDAEENFVSSHESVWFSVEASPASSLALEVIPELVKRAREVGLRVDPKAKWQVKLTNLIDKPRLIDKDGGGLIKVTSIDGENNGIVREFLRNYQAESRTTSRGILFILSHHVNKNISLIKRGGKWIAVLPKMTSEIWRLAPGMAIGSANKPLLTSNETYMDDRFYGFYLNPSSDDPCPGKSTHCLSSTNSFADAPPIPTWSRQKFKANVLHEDNVKFFVSGYEARPIGDKVFEYWGLDHSKANVTVVANGRVVNRTQILSNSSSIPVLGGATVSRR